MVMSMLWGMTGVTVEEFTIDELAARTGTTVRTIRFYSENGLLPPPSAGGGRRITARRTGSASSSCSSFSNTAMRWPPSARSLRGCRKMPPPTIRGPCGVADALTPPRRRRSTCTHSRNVSGDPSMTAKSSYW